MTRGELEELLAELSQARAELRASLEGVRDDQMAQGEVIPDTTAQDLLARSAALDQEILVALEAYLNQDSGYRPVMADVSTWHRALRDRRRSLPLMQTRMTFLMTRGELGSLLAITPAEVVEHEILYPWGERGTVRRLIESYCIDTDREVAAAIRAWRNREGV